MGGASATASRARLASELAIGSETVVVLSRRGSEGWGSFSVLEADSILPQCRGRVTTASKPTCRIYFKHRTIILLAFFSLRFLFFTTMILSQAKTWRLIPPDHPPHTHAHTLMYPLWSDF